MPAIALGAMMAFDMWGPVDKAAYTFAQGLTDAGNWVSIAGVMVGGMTSPLTSALVENETRRHRPLACRRDTTAR